ncbi:MAG: putative sulfate exporter family transporter [Pirellulaceae bacterium]
MNDPTTVSTTPSELPATPNPARPGWSEDWTAAWLGLAILAVGFVLSLATQPAEISRSITEAEVEAGDVVWNSPVKGWVGKVGEWKSQPLDAFRGKSKGNPGDVAPLNFVPLLGAWLGTIVVGAIASLLRGRGLSGFLLAFPVLFVLSVLAYLLASQTVISNYNLEYALWALLVGLIISNTIGTPQWLRPAVLGEMYIKLGLVLLGAEVLFGRLLALGIPGICVSWIVTPVVLVSTYVFGQRVLKMDSKSLNMVISADMSVCGVSAAIATSAACRAKKEELSLAIGLSLSFTVVMMVVMPIAVKAIGLDPVVGGAWIGGTIDATGAVVAAGEALGPVGQETASTVKMIQNILIGVIAFAVAVYWTKSVESAEGGQAKTNVGASEIWKRFPKFILGFVAASLLCSIVFAASTYGELLVNSVVSGVAKPLRGWLFCLAFVCIGLDTNFRQLLPYFKTGKPVALYICGQTLNILLTLAMAYLMFGVLFKDVVK